ncbi:MAG: M23 family metallopeptidase [Candidatus Vogelbacteria bacterium]|nr:M23 family metallopeptidase [Candidatus Vogelbacteria bacterium]
MKKVGICLASFFSLGAIGPCLGPAAPPAPDENETVETPSAVSESPSPPEPIEPTEPNEPVIPPPPIAPPRPPEPTPLPPPTLPPPPTPLPPITIEPELKTWTCDEFPALPLDAAPGEEITRLLTEDEITYYWRDDQFCSYGNLFPPRDPYAPNDCEKLILSDWADQYFIVSRFDLSELPTANNAIKAELLLSVITGDVFLYFPMTIGRLGDNWWQNCPDALTDWQPICEADGPQIAEIYSPSRDWWDDGENEPVWLRLDFSPLYQQWQGGISPNQGLQLSGGFGYNYLIFASAGHGNPVLRPRLVITTKERAPTLHFPLAGVYDESRITGYNFGEWWLERRCDDSDSGSPRLRHTGIDLHATVSDKVYAVYDGTVRYAKTDPTWGGYVVLEHDGVWTSGYIHVWPTIQVGDQVTRGDQIATIASGNVNYSPHLHFQVLDGAYDDPVGMTRRGRLPDESCAVAGSPYPQPEPDFPDKFVDPKCLDWE